MLGKGGAKVGFLLAIFLISFTVSGQIGDQFWFVAPEVTAQHADRPIYLRLASFQSPSTVKISMPSNPAFAPITVTVPVDQSVSVDLTPYIDMIETKPPHEVLNNGLFIESTTSITAYYEVVGSRNAVDDGENRNSDIFALKGANALGTEFFTSFQTVWANAANTNAYSSFDIVATENDTEVKIIPSADVNGVAAGDTITVFLDKGQTYSVRADGITQAQHLAGSHIIASKPVAVTVKDDSVYNDGPHDLVGDQIVPVSVIGDEYIVTKGEVTPADKAFVLAASDSTVIYINGAIADTIMQGETFAIDVTDPFMHIKTSSPAYVFHVSGFGKELGGALLPPTMCTGSPFVSFTRSSPYPFFLNVLVESGAEDGFTLNGSTTLIPASAFQDVPGTNGLWKAAHLEFSEAQIAVGSSNLISNRQGYFHVGTISGMASGASGLYGYFSNFAKLELGKVDEPLCPGETISVDAGLGADQYIWKMETDTGWVEIGYESSILVDSTGQFSVEQHKGLTCILHDTISVYYNPDIKVHLGPDTIICPETNLILDAGDQFVSYIWQDSSTFRYFNPDTSGHYWIETINQYNCKSRDSVQVIFRDPYSIDLGEDTTVCFGQSVILTPGDTLATYLWNDGSTLDSLVAKATGTYHVTVTNSHSCLSYDTLNLIVRPFYDIDLGPDQALCEGDSASFTPGVFTSYLWHNGSDKEIFYTDTTGIFSVSGLNEFDCPAEDSVLVIVNPNPDFSLGPDQTVCEGTPVSLDPGDFKSYSWQDGAYQRLYPVVISGTYIVTVTNNYDCKNSDTVDIVVNPLPEPELEPDQVFCEDEFALLYPGSFENYQWNDGTQDTSLLVKVSGKYKVIVTNEYNCQKADSVSVQVNPNPQPSLGPDMVFCANEAKELNPGNFTSYLWSTGAVTPTIPVEVSGDYYVEVTNEFGCTGSDILNAIINPLPQPFLGEDTVVCTESAITLDPGDGFISYLWHDNSTAATYIASSDGLYFVKVTNEFNCEKTDSLSIAFFPPFTVTAGPDFAVCPGEPAEIKAVLEGSGSFSFNWNPGGMDQQNITVFPEEDINFTVEVRDENGCAPVSDDVSVSVNPVPDEPLESENVLHCFESGPVLLEVGTASTYSWLPGGQTTQSINVTGAGEYYVTVTNEFGCAVQDMITIEPICPPRLYVAKAFSPNGDGNNDHVTIFGDHFSNFKMEVYNRWGELIYVTTDRNLPWDGYYRGELMPDDVYPWVISYESLYENDPDNPRRIKGAVALIK